jgi:hypothetical protein
MIRNLWTLALSLTLVWALAAAPVAAAEAKPGPLDGKSFAGETGEKGKAKGDPESFVFRDGKFDPIQCHPYGFSAAPYTARSEAGAVSFESETVSAKEGKMLWKGTVRGDALEGTMVWSKEGQAPLEYWFRAKLTE